MNGDGDRAALLFGLGGVLLLGILAKAVLRRFDVPALVGYLAIGVLCGTLDRRLGLLPPGGTEVFHVLADIGIVCVLFRVGLESDLRVLARELPRAALVLVGNVVLSLVLAYSVGRAFGLDVLASLVLAVALSATSIALSTYVWEGAGLLRTRTGSLVLDTAQLDDLVTVLLMVLLFAFAPTLLAGGVPGPGLGEAVGSVAFVAVCYGLARFGEARITRSFRKLRHGPEPILVLIGTAMVVAATAGALGFSLAIGAMFAGLVFSRDPRAVRLEAAFDPIYALFAPFFFVDVGMRLDLGAMPGALGLGLALTAVAVVGKVVGSAVPVWPSLGRQRALAVGVSMVPRAEIALFVAEQGRSLGVGAVPEVVHGAVFVVVALTCTLTPPVLRRLLCADSDATLDVRAETGCDRPPR
jgi:Kef-type K+ transport system membrane component KefB